MSHVSTTTHYNLPIYGGSDIINPLTDVNGTNEAVDTAIYEVSQALASGVTDITAVKNKVGDASLDTASQNLSGAVNELKSAIDTQGGDITDIEGDVGTLQSQMATTTGNITTLNTTVAGLQTEVGGKASQTAVNTLATKVGTDALITTADNLSGAVNELKNDVDDLTRATPDVIITADGVKTLQTLFNEIANAIDFTKLSKETLVVMHRGVDTYVLHNFDVINDTVKSLRGGFLFAAPNAIQMFGYRFSTALSACYANYVIVTSSGNTLTDESGTIATNGDTFEVYY